jgi:hypothetical protein
MPPRRSPNRSLPRYYCDWGNTTNLTARCQSYCDRGVATRVDNSITLRHKRHACLSVDGLWVWIELALVLLLVLLFSPLAPALNHLGPSVSPYLREISHSNTEQRVATLGRNLSNPFT